MKKLVNKLAFIAAVLFMTLSVPMNGQIIGFNGTNTPEVLVPEVRGYVAELAVDTIGMVFRDDKYLGAAAPAIELENVIALSNELKAQGKTLAVCFTVYTRTGMSVTNAMADLDALRSGGVFIYSVRGGNEEWAKVAGHNGDFNTYWTKVEPYLEPLSQRGVNKFLIPVARPADKPDWNALAATKLNSSELYQPDYHPYWGPNQVKVLDTLGEDETLPTANLSSYASFQDWFYQTLYEQVLAYDLLSEIREWHNANIPTKEWHITEFGPPTAVGHISNAIGFDATTDWFFNAVKAPNVKFVARFNGPSPTGTAIISPRGKKDETQLPSYVRRLAYYTLYNAIRHKNAETSPTLNESREYVVSVQNITKVPKKAHDYYLVSPDYMVTDVSFTGVWGTYYYSGSGTIEWWAKDSPKTYEVNGVQTLQGEDIPAMSYGYLRVTVVERVYGCTDPEALNFNPDATVDDGSCIAKVYGCTDPTATNYNPEANIDNGMCVIITVQCYQKRWLFKSLPCKLSKTNNCNCNK